MNFTNGIIYFIIIVCIYNILANIINIIDFSNVLRDHAGSNMYKDRIKLYKRLETEYKGKVIAYITGDRAGFGAQIEGDVIDPFIAQLDTIGVVKNLILYLYTRGGNTSVAWNIVNLIRMYCDNLIVIVPHKAHSAGTIISLGANKIVMTKQATLSPIDPSLNTPLNPKLDIGGTYPVSVEAVNGYIELAKNEFNLNKPSELSVVLDKLTQFVHPLVLGQVYRSRAQIKMLAERLLKNQIQEGETIDKIISFLCSESGSHDYTINRREAEKDLGLKIEKPTDEQYSIIKSIYEDFSIELGLNNNSGIPVNDAFSVRCAFLESIEGGSDYFSIEGKTQCITNGVQSSVKRIDTFSGWRHMQFTNVDYKRQNMKKETISYESDDKFGL